MLLCCYLLIALCIPIIKSIDLNFETSSTASQFIDLENLIGSFHTYAPTSSKLFVRDMGLTIGQKKLLKRYENVQVVRFRYTRPEGTQKINVYHEFFLINNILYDRYNQGKAIFINSIRKHFYLAIVIPFIESQFNQTVNQLKLNKFYPPCHNHSNSIDLIFYRDKKRSSLSKNNISQFNYSNQCYESIHYISADLSDEENLYPVSSANMWKRLFINEQFSPISLRARGYTHFFLMGPDTQPIRSFWLDAIVEQITNGHNQESYVSTKWWMMGSIYRGSEPIGTDFLHINGDALYHLSFDFIQFIENVSIEYPYSSEKSMGYDLDLFLYLFNHTEQAKHLWHKFQFTDFIQNCWHKSCNETSIEFIYNNPNTYLIHGYKVREKPKKKIEKPKKKIEHSSNTWYYIVYLGILLLVLQRFRHLCRRFYCKRSIIIDYSDAWKRFFKFR
jgi:hypothetical protein